MKQLGFICIVCTFFFSSTLFGNKKKVGSEQKKEIIKEYIVPSTMDVLVEDIDDLHYLIQINLINDSLHQRLSSYMPELGLNIGAASYQRIINSNNYEKVKSIISEEFYKTIEFPYSFNRSSRSYWVKVKSGDETQGTWSDDDAVEYTCACLDDASGCVKLGWDEDWWNPLDYYAEAWWGFSPPYHEQIDEVRVTIRGAQCDDLPLWSETYMGMRDEGGGWSDDFLLSIDYTDNVFVVSPTWSESMLMPIIGSEDNYTVDQVKLEFFYSCNNPQNPTNMQASDSESCSTISLDWEKSTTGNVTHQYLYRDDQIIAQLEPNVSSFQDSGATDGEVHAYCVQAFNDCGSTSIICDTGNTESSPNSPAGVASSDGEYSNQVVTTWQAVQGATQYKIYRDDSWVGVDSSEPFEFIDIFVETNQPYTYCVEAINECGESGLSCDTGFSTYAIGDINFDSIINILDIVLIVNHILEISFLNEDQLLISDINSDGEINVIDVVVLISIILN